MRDLTGMKSGKLTVLEPQGKAKDGHYRWLCKCDCGNTTVVQSNNLVSKTTMSCGCLLKEIIGDHDDLTGMHFGRLIAVKRAENKSHQVRWLCRCSCGKQVVVSKSSLRNGCTKSCGCLNKEKTIERNTTHNESRTRLYKIWAGMKRRCKHIKDKNYKLYGGRGIKVCEEWLNDFVAFRDWALTNGYADKLTLDRIDVNGNYEPSNCRWATTLEQANNKRNNHTVTFNGETRSIREWAILLGVNYGSLRSRIQRGWSVERAFATPLNTNKGVNL